MKRRSFLQVLVAVFAATASLNVQAHPASLRAAPFVLAPECTPAAPVIELAAAQ